MSDEDQPTPATTERTFSIPSFAKGLFLGEIHTDMVMPYPRPDAAEREKTAARIQALHEATRHYDPKQVEEEGWVGDDTIRALGEGGLLGLSVPEEFGGQELSQTAYCQVFEEIGQIDATLAVVLGVHQSIGLKGIQLFGSEDQQARFLPDLAAGRKLAAFALTEPNAGSDAYHLDTRAVPQPDGSYRLSGEKRYIGNGSKDVIVTFARTDEGAHVALIVERGMAGFEVGRSYATMGLKGNDLRHLRFNDVRVPPENVLGEPGQGFKIAMEILNVGRLSLGTGTVGAARKLIDLALEHVNRRKQFGQPLADFELVQEKIAWMVSYLYGLQSMAYLTSGLADAGVEDYSLESAIVKVAGTEFVWYAANRVFQLAGGEAYLADKPYEKILRDIRVFPIFEGANDVLRCYIALTGLKPLGEELSELTELDLSRPLRSLGLWADYVGGWLKRKVRPQRLTGVHGAFDDLVDPVAEGVARLRQQAEQLLRDHGSDIAQHQGQLKRLAHAVMDLYAQIATLSRVSDVLETAGPSQASHERYIAETFCARAANRVERWLGQIETNDDDRMRRIAQMAYDKGCYGHGI